MKDSKGILKRQTLAYRQAGLCVFKNPGSEGGAKPVAPVTCEATDEEESLIFNRQNNLLSKRLFLYPVITLEPLII
ncbi:MAG: hypothetical protein WC682_00780 [Parcubacteria group bacterium]